MNTELSPKVKHIPLRPPRDCTPGEGIYLELWRKYIAEPGHIDVVFYELPFSFRQRAASVAASFMVFMGCNGGHSFTHAAEVCSKNSSAFSSVENAYLATWAIQNQRCRGINNGVRLIEAMLDDTITQDDAEVIECMVTWWSTHDAKEMRRLAEPKIHKAVERRRVANHVAARLKS